MSEKNNPPAPLDRLSHRLSGVAESATLKLNAAVQALKAKNIEVFNFTTGEPDFNVPDAAKEAVIEALKANRSKYTPVPGIPELRRAVAEKTNTQQPSVAAKQPWKPEHVVVSNGGKQSLFNIFLALLSAGDEVLIPGPYWLSYPEMVRLCDGTPRIIAAPFSQGFKITPDQLRRAINPRVRAVVFNSPCNPTGAMYSKAEFQALAEVLRSPEAAHIWVISDEIYDRIVLGSIPFCSFLEAAPDFANRAVTVNGMSKSAAMTGWRIGWTVAPAGITQALNTLQGQSTSGINALAQWAAFAALKLPESQFASQVESYKRRRNLTLEILKKTSKIEVLVPDGAFYVFVGIKRESVAFAEALLEQFRVAVVPGTPFGEPEFVRLSFATDERTIQEGCERLVRFVEQS